jgi:transposase-like protein
MSNRAGRLWSDADKERCRQLLERGWTYERIAEELERSPGAIESKAQEFGLGRRIIGTAPRLWTQPEDDQLRALYAAGYSDEKIAAKIERRTVEGVGNRRRVLGLCKDSAGKPTAGERVQRATLFSPFGKPDLFALWDERNNRLLARANPATTRENP